MSVAALIGPVAMRQHGLAHLRQPREAGATKSAIEEAMQTGELERRLPEVYAVAGAPRTWRHNVMAAVLDGGPEAVASHRTAAILQSVADRNAPRIVEITVPRRLYSRSPGVIVHRSLDLTPDHVVVIDGIPCTGPLRTLVDLGAVEPWFVVADAFERALQAKLVTLRGAEWMLTELSQRGRNGCGVFRRVLDTRALKALSLDPGLLEPLMARVLAGLPMPEYQYTVLNDDGEFVARVDFARPDIKEAFEVDGFEKHGTPDAVTKGFERDHRLKLAGWGVTHFNWYLVVRKPRYVRETYAAVLGAKRPVEPAASRQEGRGVTER
jgi:hypothetical protein